MKGVRNPGSVPVFCGAGILVDEAVVVKEGAEAVVENTPPPLPPLSCVALPKAKTSGIAEVAIVGPPVANAACCSRCGSGNPGAPLMPPTLAPSPLANVNAG